MTPRPDGGSVGDQMTKKQDAPIRTAETLANLINSIAAKYESEEIKFTEYDWKQSALERGPEPGHRARNQTDHPDKTRHDLGEPPGHCPGVPAASVASPRRRQRAARRRDHAV